MGDRNHKKLKREHLAKMGRALVKSSRLPVEDDVYFEGDKIVPGGSYRFYHPPPFPLLEGCCKLVSCNDVSPSSDLSLISPMVTANSSVS